MKTGTKIYSILIVICLITTGSLKAATFSDSYFSSKIQNILQAQASADLEELANQLHELSLQGFRTLLDAEVDRLTKYFSAGQFAGAIGSSPEQLKALSDKDYFIRMCQLLRLKIDDPHTLEPISIVGVVKEEAGGREVYHVIYRGGEITSVGTSERTKIVHASLMSFLPAADEAKLWNILLTKPIVSELRRRLSAAEQRQSDPAEPTTAW